MYKLYCKFYPLDNYSIYYLVDSSKLDNLNVGRFTYIACCLTEGFIMYKSTTTTKISDSVINITDTKVVDYNEFLHIYKIIKPIIATAAVYRNLESGLELQSDLDLIFVNWSNT